MTSPGPPPTPETDTTSVGPPTDASPPEIAASEPEPTEGPEGERLKGMPEYKGEPLDAERGPGLGCFWIQIALLTFFLIFTPLTVTWGWHPWISGALLIFTLILLLFTGQTVIFLLRLVAADRRTRRTPLDPGAKPTVGQMEDAAPATTPDEAPASEQANEGDEKAEGGR